MIYIAVPILRPRLILAYSLPTSSLPICTVDPLDLCPYAICLRLYGISLPCHIEKFACALASLTSAICVSPIGFVRLRPVLYALMNPNQLSHGGATCTKPFPLVTHLIVSPSHKTINARLYHKLHGGTTCLMNMIHAALHDKHELKHDGYRDSIDSYHFQPMYLAFDGVCNILEHDKLN